MRVNIRYGTGFHILVALIFLLVTIPGCSNSNRGIDGTDERLDSTPPSVISDIAVVHISNNSISLRWTAPGDDGDSGTAAIYDLRYSLTTITETNWNSAQRISGIFAPSHAGSLDSITITDLMQDSTYYFAIKTCDELNNWSGLSNIANGICIDNIVVIFADTALERVMRFYINKPSGDIYALDLHSISHINAWNQNIHSLVGLEYCRNLYALRIWNNNVTDLTPLSGLKNMRVLDVGFNRLSNIDPLASLESLDTLKLNSNQISDISSLSGMENLRVLELNYNEIWNLSPLTDKPTICDLALDGNEIVFINALYNLTGLAKLRLLNNQIEDLLPLAYNTGLGAGDTLWLSDNPLTAASTDSLIGVFRGRGVIVIR